METLPPDFRALDHCASWISHYPPHLLERAHVTVIGLNKAELDANVQAQERIAADLNVEPRLPLGDCTFDFVSNALSLQYLTSPRAVFTEIHRVLKPGGIAVMAFSNRCFEEKTVHLWSRNRMGDGEGHAHIVTDYFHFNPLGGWSSI